MRRSSLFWRGASASWARGSGFGSGVPARACSLVGHAILYPPYPLTISPVMKSIKLSSTNGLGRCRREAGELWQGRFFDHPLRSVKDYTDTVEYIHRNPVRRGLVTRPEEWTWSSYPEYADMSAVEQEKRCGLGH